MRASNSFGTELARARKGQGFSTAHAFYQGRGGRRALGLTYRNYLNLESGLSLPKPARFEAILTALGVDERMTAAQDLVAAYFTALGMGGLKKFLAGSAPASAPAGFGDLAAQQALKHASAQLSAEQWALRAKDYDADTCHLVLLNTAGGLTVPALAKAAGLTLGAAKKAVKTLAAAKLITFKEGLARSRYEDKAIRPPPASAATVGLTAALRAHTARWVENGVLVRNAVTIVRLSEAQLMPIHLQFDQLLDQALIYGDPEAGAGSAIYMVRGQIARLFP